MPCVVLTYQVPVGYVHYLQRVLCLTCCTEPIQNSSDGPGPEHSTKHRQAFSLLLLPQVPLKQSSLSWPYRVRLRYESHPLCM